MSTRGRNVITGLVVLLAIASFLWMVLKFTGRATSWFSKKGVVIRIVADRGDGISEGTPVLFRGVEVGKVVKMRRAADNTHVLIDAEVEQQPPLPHDLKAIVRVQSMLGMSAVLDLELDGAPVGTLEAGEEISATYQGTQILPPELTDFITDFRRQKLIEHTDEAIVALRTQIENAGEMMKSVQTIIGDPKLQADLKQSIANVRVATDRADRIGANLEKFSTDLQQFNTDLHGLTKNANDTVTSVRTAVDKTGGQVDELSRHLLDDVDKLGKSLDQFQDLAAKINNGNGTAGRLLNDPRMYEQLTDTAKELNAVAASIHRLVDQWEQEGMHLKLK
jgi:phospholipid/cholesterol/gamma-HCH transport system substrate-binding protein